MPPDDSVGYVEAKHHSALVMLRDVAVRHPETRVAYVEEDVDSLAGRYQHRVGPHQIGLDRSISGEHQESASSVDVEWMVHRVVAGHFIEEADLDPIPHTESPGDLMIGGV